MKTILKTYIENNIKEIFILTIILFIGLVLGVFYINNTDNSYKQDVSKSVNSIVTYIKDKKSYEISDKINIFKNSMIKNIITISIIGFLGSSLIGIPIIFIIILLNGFSIGYTMSAIVGSIGIKRGIIFICSSMLLHNIIMITGIFIASVSGINLYKMISKKREESIKFIILKHIVFCIISILFCILSAIIESFICNSLFFNLKNYI